MTTILTFQGRSINVMGSPHNEYCISDIAHALSQICRFGGHTRQFYSVAQHSVLVSRLLHTKYRLHGLLHDATEAYLGDVVTPLKRSSAMHGYRNAEVEMEADIFRSFGVEWSPEARDQVKWADLVMLATERRDLLAPSTQEWEILQGIRPSSATISPLMPAAAEALFIKHYKELAGVQ